MRYVEISKKYCLLVGIIIPLFSGMKAQTAEPRTAAPKPFVTSKEPHQENNLSEMLRAQPDQSPVRYDSAGLDSFIRITMDTAHVPGVATWCSKNGQVIWQQCYGYANLEDSIAVTDTTSFILASISKTVVGTAIMQLWERNIFFQLDDDINSYLPFNVRNPHHPDSAITFRMLMTHTSSINDVYAILDPLIHPGDPDIPLGEFLSEYLVPGGTYYSTLNFNNSIPGVTYDYSNVGSALLGYLVEAIEDSFPIHCQDSIFEPLDMGHTSWFLEGLDTNNIAVPYYWDSMTYTYVPYEHSSWPPYPSAMLRSSLADLARHLTAIWQYGILDTTRILDSTTVDLMLTPQFTVNPTYILGLIWHNYFMYTRWIWNHSGHWYGAYTVYGFCLNEGSAVVVLTNGDNRNIAAPITLALFDYALQYGVVEEKTRLIVGQNLGATIFRGPLQLPQGRKCKVYDITGRVVEPQKIQPGIYFVEVDGVVTQKVVKIR